MKLSQWLNRKSRAEENRLIKIVRNSELFDERWYISEYQDVFKKLKDPARHYYQKGWLENRNPSENFSTAEYLRKHPECNICPLVFEHNCNGYVDLSVCAIIKNEAPYMEEWLDYHLSVGVKRFYIYDNGSTDNLTEILEPYISKGLVVYKYYPGAAKQMSAYNDCIKVSKDKTEWLAVIDADEFIMPIKKNSIPEFLKEFKDCPGVGINWICYDSNGYKNKPEGGVLENYTRVHYDEQFSTNHHIKSVVRPAMVDKYITPYYAQYTEGKNAVDENGNEIKGCVYRDVHPKAYTDVVSVNKIRINHYYSKSEEEYKAKLERGRALIKDAKKQFSQRSLAFDDVKYDYTAYKFVERLYPELGQRLEIKARWFKVKNMFIGLKHIGEPSTLFDYIDEKWYFEQYPEAKKSKMTALQHYLSTGWKEGKNPSRYFDTNFYLSRYTDIAEAGINPLIHYLNAGKSAGRLPMIENSLSADNIEQLRITVSKADKKSKDYQILDNSELFDKKWYIDTYFNGQDIDAVAHYMCLGWKEGCNPSKSFDTDFYLKKYKDIAKSGQNPLLHYIKHGKEEGRLPKFNGCLLKRLWKRMNGTEFKDDELVLPHEITDEYKIVDESKEFNQKWYARKYLQGKKINPIEHYLTIGWKERSNPNSKYSTTEYLKQYPECGVCPLVFEHNRNGYVDLSICAIMKNEAPYVKEWIDYHTLVGVKRFYIYDNESTDNLKEVLTPYIAKGVVVYKYCTGESMQMPVYNECLEEYRDKNEWMAFINVDEFIVPVEKESVPEFLADYKEYPGVEVNWVNYDSNGYVTKPKGGVLENYLRRQYEIQSLKNHRGKSIVQPAECIKMKSHVGRYADGKSAVTENKEETYSRDFTDFVSVNKIRLNYYCKSKEEAAEKISKGNVANADSAKRINPQDLNFPQYIYDCTIFKYLERLNPEKSGKYSRKRTICGIKNAFIRLKHLFNKDLIEDYVDEKWYFAKYPEAKASGLSALKHYLTIGWKLGYNPSEMFDTEYYLRRYPDIAKTGHNPLLHYITYGKNAGRLAKAEPVLLAQKPQEQPEIEASELKQQKQAKTENVEAKQQASTATNAKKTDYEIIESSGLFDKEWYVSTYLNGQDVDPIKHYLSFGWKNGYNPSKKFDGNAYLDNYTDVANAGKNPLLHYLQYGQNGKRKVFSQLTLWDKIFNPYKNKPLKYRIVAQSKYFNKKWYLKQYPDVKNSGLDPIEHYLTVGWKKGFNPSVEFDGNAYLEHYQDVKKAEVNPLVHYLQYGQNGKREVFSQPTWWNKLFNFDKNKPIGYQIIAHSGYFNKKWYLKQYPDVKNSGTDPIEHYLTVGWKQGYNPSPKFDGGAYIDDYQDVADADKNPLLHYLQYGKEENRTCKEVACDIVHFPSRCKKYICKGELPSQNIRRVAIFASFSNDGKIDDYVVYYLKSLKKVCDAIIFVADNPIEPNEAEKIKKYVTYAKFERHEEHCFGSYKRGYFYALDNNLLDNAEEIVFCNDSFCGPVYPFKKMFDEMDDREADFWSLLSDNRNEYYLDKSFWVFKNEVFNASEFTEFWKHIEKPINVKQFANKYEIMLTQILKDKGVVCDSYIRFTNDKTQYPYMFGDNLAYFPLWLLNQGCPLVKLKTLYKYGEALESVNKVISYVKRKNIELGNIIDKYKQNPAKVKFSVIMPTYNRKDIISEAIDSLLNQTYQKFELIIVDDGSVDDTYSYVKNKYGKELKKGKIKYYYKENGGVCKARNYGLSKAGYEWITYLDSDNMVYPVFLETFAVAIQENPNVKTFYADMCRDSNRKRASRDFDLNQMYFANFIDLGVFCNHKSVYDELGGFDENIKRLVDWELILRYTKKYTPYHISKSIMLYNDIDDHVRISNSLNYRDYFNYVRKKHSEYPVITTMITTYNHQNYITEAIESAIKQTGHFIHEIIISDDGSTDDTPKIIAEYAEQYPHLIRNISTGKNVGISANMKKCFETATGKYIAVLEGDDYWTDAQKLEKQMKFLEGNDDCSMVFSRVKVYNEDTKHAFLLDRHNNLPEKLTGKHFLKEMSLIVNFSCAMYRKDYLQDLPEVLYEGRLSEIALAMYLEKKGKIGFISTPLSVYRQNSGGVWSGSDKKKQILQGLIARQTALEVCADKYKQALQKIIDEQYVKPLKKLEDDEQQVVKQAV